MNVHRAPFILTILVLNYHFIGKKYMWGLCYFVFKYLITSYLSRYFFKPSPLPTRPAFGDHLFQGSKGSALTPQTGSAVASEQRVNDRAGVLFAGGEEEGVAPANPE